MSDLIGAVKMKNWKTQKSKVSIAAFFGLFFWISQDFEAPFLPRTVKQLLLFPPLI